MCVVMSKDGGSHPFPRHWTRGGWGVDTHPLLLIPNGGHHIYGRQAGGAHPTGMLSWRIWTPVIVVSSIIPQTEEIISHNELLDLLIYDWWRRTRINAANSHLAAVYFQGTTWSRWLRLLSEPGPEEPDTLSTHSTSLTDLRYSEQQNYGI